jgi:hypothetical protein
MTAFADALVVTSSGSGSRSGLGSGSGPSQNASAADVLRVIPLIGSRLESVAEGVGTLRHVICIHDCRRQSHAVAFDSASTKDAWCELLAHALREAHSLITAPYEAASPRTADIHPGEPPVNLA